MELRTWSLDCERQVGVGGGGRNLCNLRLGRASVLVGTDRQHLSMKCEELLAALNEYVDGHLDPGICEAFEKHLKDCNPCQIVVDNIRKTITLYRAGEPFEIPVELHRCLCARLRDCWKLKFPAQDEGAGLKPE